MFTVCKDYKEDDNYHQFQQSRLSESSPYSTPVTCVLVKVSVSGMWWGGPGVGINLIRRSGVTWRMLIPFTNHWFPFKQRILCVSLSMTCILQNKNVNYSRLWNSYIALNDMEQTNQGPTYFDALHLGERGRIGNYCSKNLASVMYRYAYWRTDLNALFNCMDKAKQNTEMSYRSRLYIIKHLVLITPSHCPLNLVAF